MTIVQILIRGDTAANWASNNPVLALRELAEETDTQKLKLGDGVTPWNSLSYWVPSVPVTKSQIIATGLAAADIGADVSGAAAAAQSASLQKSSNLSDVANAATARTNLGLGSAAVQPSTAFDAAGSAATVQAASLQKSSNLSDVVNASTARTNLGLGTAATQPSTAFDTAGAAATVQAASLQKSSNLSDLASASVARANLGLGSSATQPSTAFDTAGAASAAQTAAQASSLQKSANLSDLTDAAAARANLGVTTGGGTGLQPTSNLSDVTSPASSRAHLGLGSIAPYYTHDVENIRQGNPPINLLEIPGLDLWLDASYIDKALIGYDWFGRADSASALGTADDGSAWTTVTGTMGISGHAAYMPGGTSAQASKPSGGADSVQDYVITVPSSGSVAVDLYPRFSSSTNYICVHLVNSHAGTNTVQVVSDVAGTVTQLGFNGAAALPSSGTFTVRVKCKGNVYTVYLNPTATTDGSTLVAASTDAGSNFITVATLGIGFGSSDTASRINAVDVSAGTPVDGDAISVWPDASQTHTFGAPQQATVASRPTYKASAGMNARPSLLFSGTGQVLLSTTVPATDLPVTIIAAIQRQASAVSHAIVASGAGGLEFRVSSTDALEALKTNTSSLGVGKDKVVTGAVEIVALTIESNGNIVLYQNSQPNPAYNASLPALTAGTFVNIGGISTGSENFNGYIGAIGRWPRVLKGPEIRKAINGLAQAYGVTLPPRIGVVGTTPLRPVRIRGANFSPVSADYSGDPVAGDVWSKVWNTWNWAGEIQVQVDKAKAAGANGIRIIGDVGAPYNGVMTIATMQARWQQLAAYCQSQGMYLYPCFSDLRHMGGAPIDYATFLIAAISSSLVSYTPWIAGVDVSNEIGSGYGTFGHRAAIAAVAKWTAAVRNSLPGVPVTVSNSSQAAGTNSMLAWLTDYQGLGFIDRHVDFWDFHFYPTPTIRSQISDFTAFAAMNYKPLVLGEFGIDRTVWTGSPTPTTGYTDLVNFVNGNPDVWQVYHWDVMSDSMGLYSAAGVLQTDFPPLFSTIPAGDL